MPCLVASGRNGRGSCCPVAGGGLPRSQACIGLPVYAAACRVRVGPGHWDVPDACAVLPEAWELVERGHVAVDDFKAFTHDNALALWGDKMFAKVIGTRDCALADRDRRVRRRRDRVRSQRRRRSARDHAHARRRRHACRVVPAGAEPRGQWLPCNHWDCRGLALIRTIRN